MMLSNAVSAAAAAATAATSPSTNGFGIVTYNVLAKSLGTNMIPWVMNVAPSIQTRIVNGATTPLQPPNFHAWVEANLKPEYMKHFHKNFYSGNYAVMREFWGATQLKQPSDIPMELQRGLTFVGEDTVSYTTSDEQEETCTARTLRGVAKECLSNIDNDKTLFEDFFQDVVGQEQRIFAWKVRGPRIFRTIFDNSHMHAHAVDIIALQEYDFHTTPANYRNINGEEETFAQAMAAMGYDGVFLKDPLKGRDPPSGLGVFWNRNVFETVASTSSNNTCNDGAQNDNQPGQIQVLECDTQGFDGAVVNQDLQEQWHPITKDPSTCTQQFLKAADRRNAVLARLLHKETKKVVSVCAAHFMTTSRDGSKTNLFPGEVRAGEIANVKKYLVEAYCQEDDALLFMGDFNTNAGEEARTIFGGDPIQATVPTTRNKNDATTTTTTTTTIPPPHFDTGFDKETLSFRWGPHWLVDAFEEQHQWGQGVGSNTDDDNKKKYYCSSRNAARVEWIDYVFYDKQKLECKGTSESLTPNHQIPDESNPSDHLPLFATFEFRE